MAKKKKNEVDTELWEGVTEEDFTSEDNVEDVEIGEFDKKHMTLFAGNVNLFRLIIRLTDSLKPVERRILYSLYRMKVNPGTIEKSSLIIGNTMKYHSHGDQAIYSSMVGMIQPWKKAIPLIRGKGNFANYADPDNYAHYRYTEGGMSKFAWECFFDDFDMECVETVFNTACNKPEPMSLPSKFPNIFINGGMGFAFGNAFMIPPYNVRDIIENTKAVLRDPENARVFMVPDFPGDCDIIDDGSAIQSIVDTGTGNLKVRGRIEIEEYRNTWGLVITSVPWMANFTKIIAKLTELTKKGILPLTEIHREDIAIRKKDGSTETRIHTRLIFSKAHDPNVLREKVFSMTEMEKTFPINFRVVTENMTVESFNMKDILIAWCDERRSYKRRLYNKRLTRILARIEYLEIILYLLEKDRVQTVTNIIRKVDRKDIPARLQKEIGLNSHQASLIADVSLKLFSKDSKKTCEDELKKLKEEQKMLEKLVGSEKQVDDVIADELDDLAKYYIPRRTRTISPSTGERIPDTDHLIVISDRGFIKKLMYKEGKNPALGAFKSGDFPIHTMKANNLDTLVFMDSFGRYSSIPVHEIENNESSQYGHNAFTLLKLAGKIVSVTPMLDRDEIEKLSKLGTPYLLSITQNGYIKKTAYSVFQEIRTTKNIRCMKIRDDDSMIYSRIILGNANLLIYTKKGQYLYVNGDAVPEQSKDSLGVTGIKVDADDRVVRCSVIHPDDKYVAIVTEKGLVKKVPVTSLGLPGKRNGTYSSIITPEAGDGVSFEIGIKENSGILVCSKSGNYPIDTIPEMTKKAKGKKMIPLPNGMTILGVIEKPN